MSNEKIKEAKYFTGKLTLLELMTVLALLGIGLTWFLRHYFILHLS